MEPAFDCRLLNSKSLPNRLVVGRRSLEAKTGVRIPVRQQANKRFFINNKVRPILWRTL